jgi:hypothetical protein
LGEEGSDNLPIVWNSGEFTKEPTSIIAYELQLLVLMDIIYGYQDEGWELKAEKKSFRKCF